MTRPFYFLFFRCVADIPSKRPVSSLKWYQSLESTFNISTEVVFWHACVLAFIKGAAAPFAPLLTIVEQIQRKENFKTFFFFPVPTCLAQHSCLVWHHLWLMVSCAPSSYWNALLSLRSLPSLMRSPSCLHIHSALWSSCTRTSTAHYYQNEEEARQKLPN